MEKFMFICCKISIICNDVVPPGNFPGSGKQLIKSALPENDTAWNIKSLYFWFIGSTKSGNHCHRLCCTTQCPVPKPQQCSILDIFTINSCTDAT